MEKFFIITLLVLSNCGPNYSYDLATRRLEVRLEACHEEGKIADELTRVCYERFQEECQ